MRRTVILLGLCALGAVTTCAAEETRRSKSGFQDVPQFGGPSSVGAELAEEDAVKQPWVRTPVVENALQPWFDWKGGLNEKYGIAFGLSYNALYQAADQSAGAEDDAAGGIFDLKGSWMLLEPDADHRGSFQWNVGHLHKLGTDIAPADLGFESGYLGIPGTKFSGAENWALISAAWRQELNGNKLVAIVGFQDPTDYIDVYAMENPLTAFQNLVFTVNPTIAAPNAGSLSAVVGGMATDNLYYMAGLADANGSPTSPSFDTAFDQGEFFYHAELGLVPSQERLIFDRITLFGWYQDEREEAVMDDSSGVALTVTKFIDEQWMPFLRAGYSDGNAPLFNETVSIGLGRYFGESRDLLGVAYNWGQPADGSLREQHTTEAFYRIQIAQNLQLTPSVQWLVDPALDPEQDQIWVGSLRARLTL